MTNQAATRLSSIDVFRAVTMFLMIFVNDLWTLRDIPAWLEHTAADADDMGLADTIFPAFLFIVGLSIPFALQARLSRGANTHSTMSYILTRSIALLIMGLFHVNLDGYSTTALLPHPVYQILVTVGFFLVWLDYPRTMPPVKKRLLIGLGIALLALLAALYKGGEPGHEVWMRPQWWGILGLIGWSYLLAAMITLFSRDRLLPIIAALLFFHLFNIGYFAGWLQPIASARKYLWIAGNGSMPAITMAGVLVSAIYRQYLAANTKNITARYISVLLLVAAAMFLTGFWLRSFWGLSKIRATPAWALICTGISIVAFVAFIVVIDLKKKASWFDWIKPAGTSTLTCYLLPYLHYAMYTLAGITLPMYLRMGTVGLVKSLLYALLIVVAAGLLAREHIRLRI